ncbi:glycosyltransferase [Actinomyces polynesiensis]|uniref:glycosyltransferase n=1 Tax=Actinomyces polynesiensis TaxID=1325934 RepID=UPI0005B8B8ED|nr:glycosyltransferase [Actinomyces polynesiensis]
MRVLGFGTYDVRSHPRVGVLLDGMRTRGHAVTELNRPLGIGTAGRVAALSHPTQLAHFVLTLLLRWLSLAAGSLRFRGTSHPDVVLVGYLGHFDVLLARLLYPRTRIVLDHLVFAAGTATDRGTKEGVRTALLRRLDRMALRAADVVIVDTGAHRELVPADLRSKVVVVPVGAPMAWFHARRPAEDIDRTLSVIFFGLFTPLQGAPAIAEGLRRAASERDLRITMVGTGQDYDTCRDILGTTQVTWVDWVDSADLPSLVARHDLCLGILGTTPKALRVVPNKVYQGMAAGCAVITSDTAPQREVLGDDALWCRPGAPEDLARILVELDGARLVEMRRRSGTRADARFTPAEVVAPLDEVLA